MNKIESAGGFAAGTRLLSRNGFTPVECVEVGDSIITRRDGMSRVTQIVQTRVETRFVRFQAHSLGEQSPRTELLLPQDQRVLVRDWRAQEIFDADFALVEARALVDDVFVTLTEPRTETLFQLSFATHAVLYLEGVEVGSANAVTLKKPRVARDNETSRPAAGPPKARSSLNS